MRRSILWPPKLAGGRLVMTPDPDSPGSDLNVALRQIVGLGLLDGNNGNPFNTDLIALDDATWRGDTQASRARISAGVRTWFAALETARRARLIGVVFSRDGATTTITITYENLETGGRQSMELSRNG